jgi:hypothetical protein
MSDTLFNVEAYHQEPPRRVEVCDPSWVAIEKELKAGETITTCSGTATVTHTETIGREQIIWADYGSGVEHPHIQENLLSTEQIEARAPAKQRRHSRKGEASGWIEERIGNKKRANPTTSYYYCWQEGDCRMKVYVKARKMWKCNQMVESRCSVDEILRFLND